MRLLAKPMPANRPPSPPHSPLQHPSICPFISSSFLHSSGSACVLSSRRLRPSVLFCFCLLVCLFSPPPVNQKCGAAKRLTSKRSGYNSSRSAHVKRKLGSLWCGVPVRASQEPRRVLFLQAVKSHQGVMTSYCL